MRPVAHPDGHDAPGLLGELVPCVAAMVDDFVIGLWNGPPSFGIVELPNHVERSGTMKNIAILGIDLGTNVRSLVGLDGVGTVVLRRRMKREGMPAFAERLLPASLRWKRAAGRIMWGGFSWIARMRSD